MLLQVALDKPEHLSIVPRLKGVADILEVGTPLLKRFGVSAIATVRELCPDVPVLADTKTVDGGALEADMMFSAGASYITVLSCAAQATLDAVGKYATAFGGSVVIDTITESGKSALLPQDFRWPEAAAYVAVHAPTDARLAGDTSTRHIDAVKDMHERGFRVSLAGGIGPSNLDAAIAAKPEILVVGSAITESETPEKVARWIKERLPNPGLGWPWDKK